MIYLLVKKVLIKNYDNVSTISITNFQRPSVRVITEKTSCGKIAILKTRTAL